MDDPTRLTGDLRPAAGALFTADLVQFLPYILLDIRRWQLRAEGKAIVEDDRLRVRRAEKLRQLQPSEVFPAGSVLLTGPDGRPDPRPAVVAVTEADLVLLSSDVEAPEEEIARIPRGEITGVCWTSVASRRRRSPRSRSSTRRPSGTSFGSIARSTDSRGETPSSSSRTPSRPRPSATSGVRSRRLRSRVPSPRAAP
jgi:hypothetical protein